MTRDEAIDILIDVAGRWAENAEEGLPSRLDALLCHDDQIFEHYLSELEDDWERDMARDVRAVWQATELLRPERGE